ncbi:MAG: hypothetical protein MR763_06045 [Clostridiales bacterium]|nr:hypothetical protein [Clostridiales bacterium]
MATKLSPFLIRPSGAPSPRGKVFPQNPQSFKQQATSKNYFLAFWARDFVPTKVLESSEYWMYCGLFKTHCWGKRSVQNPKG